jgi:5-methyltetrahydrofolate--homocysteine methyltransferase
MSLLRALDEGPPLLMDGAMGTRLMALGVSCPERANLAYPDRVRAVHAGYVAAGARVLLTNTFQANPAALARHGLEEKLEEIVLQAVRLAHQEARGGFVLGSVGPILSPGSRVEFADRTALARAVAALDGVDALLFETCSTPEALAAVAYVLHRVPEADGKPLLLSLTYHVVDGRLVTWSGHGPEVYARHAARHGVAALGVNCGKEIDTPELLEVLRRYRQETDLPLFVRPNAGTPDAQGRYPRSAERLAAAVPAWLEAGARMVGGCCGTSAATIEAMGARLPK